MADFLNFGGKIKMENDQQYGEYPVVCSPIPNGTIKEEPTSEEDDGECELVVYPPPPQGVFKEELEIEDDHVDFNSEISVVSNAATTADNIGFLQIVPGSVVSLAHQSPPATMEIDVTQIKMEKTEVESDIVQENYLIAYYPLPKEAIKEEPHSRNGQNGCESDKQLTTELEENLDSTLTLIDMSSTTADLENETEQGIDLPRTSKRKRSASKDDMIEPFRGAKLNNRKRTQKRTAFSGPQSVESMLRTDRVHPSRPKERSALLIDWGGTRGTRRDTEELGKSHGKSREQLQAARSVRTEEMSEHSSLEGMDSSDGESAGAGVEQMSEHSSLEGLDSSDGESTAEDIVPNHSTVGPSQQSKQKAIEKPSKKIGHPEQNKGKDFRCKNCGKSFKLGAYLKKHLAITCGVVPKYPCKECGNLFKSQCYLQRHLMKIHGVEKSKLASSQGTEPKIRPAFPFKCHKCEKTYKQKQGLAYHLNYDCGLSPCFPCTLCDYKARRKNHLRVHLMAIHNVDRSQFAAFGAAALSVRPEQPFKCDKCGRTYKWKGNLKQHLTYDCGVDPSFLCTQCDYRASFKSTLTRHIINAHCGTGLLQPV